MSEHQRIAFRAVDGPVTEKNLDYMRKESSRAEITPWAFDNEYNYGDFHGNAEEMLRRGYDLHLHYANFGIRKLLIRLPHGLPDPSTAKPYFAENSLQLLPDKQGSGGILSIEPYYEPGDQEDLWELDGIVERLVPLRAEILDGDLRPLYLAHLAMACDMNHDPEETREAPVPGGLQKLSDAQRALAELYGLSDSLIAAAAKECPPLPSRGDSQNQQLAWLQRQPQTNKDAWLAQWLADPGSTVRREILEEFRKSTTAATWPTVRRDRTIAELQAAAAEIELESNRKATAKAVQQRAKKLAAMAADPHPTLRKTEELVASRSSQAYGQVADFLADLREALAGGTQPGLAEQQARKLKKHNPTLHLLTRELRRKGFLAK